MRLAAGVAKRILDRLRPMNVGSIPNDEHLAWDVAQELLQESDHVGTFVGTVLRLHEEASISRDGSNGET